MATIGSLMSKSEIRELMKLRGWTQRQLATELQVNEGTVSKWLSGDNEPMGPCRVLMRHWLIEARARDKQPA